MLFFRLWLLFVIVGAGWAVICYAFTRDRRYLRLTGTVIMSAAGVALLLVALRYAQRLL